MTEELHMTKVAMGVLDTPADAAFAWRHSSFAVRCLTLAIRAYQLTVSPAQTFLFGPLGGCRHTPTCSVYAVEALRGHGLMAGAWLATKRLCRCHPWGGCGPDPVPPKGRLEIGGRSEGNASGPNSQRSCPPEPLRMETICAPGKRPVTGGQRPALRIQDSEATI